MQTSRSVTFFVFEQVAKALIRLLLFYRAVIVATLKKCRAPCSSFKNSKKKINVFLSFWWLAGYHN